MRPSIPALVAALAISGPLGALPGLAPAARAQDWTVVPLGTTATIRALEKTSSALVYAVGDSGTVLRADDSTHLLWSAIDVGTTADLLAVFQPSAGQVWMSGAAGTVRRLVSGAWESRNLPNGSEDFVTFSRSSGGSYAAGTGGSLYRTTDGGSTWALQTSGTTSALRDGSGFTSSTAIVVGDGGTILKTTNGGTDWVAKPSGTTADLHAYRDVAGGIVAAGEGGTIVRSTDGGETWAPVASGTTATLYDVDTSLQNANWVLAAGSGGTLLRSTDGGQSWCPIDTGTTTDLFACDMTLNSTWTVAGAGGFLQVTTTAGGGCFDPVAVGEPRVDRAGFRLDGPWPQPARDAGRFALEVPRDGRVLADVVDVTGRRVERLLDARLTAGSRRTIGFAAGGWPSGVYFLRVEGEGFATTRRIVVVR